MNKIIKELIHSIEKQGVEVRTFSPVDQYLFGSYKKIRKNQQIKNIIEIRTDLTDESIEIFKSKMNRRFNELEELSDRFQIDVKNLIILDTLFHENIHCEQTRSGDLVFLIKNNVQYFSWKGSPFKKSEGFLPYEADAEERSIIELKKFLEDREKSFYGFFSKYF